MSAEQKAKTIADLEAELCAAQSRAEKVRIARELAVQRAADEERAERELAEDRDILEQELYAELPQGTRLTALSDLGALRACGTGILIVRALEDKDQEVAVRALHRVSGSSAKSAASEIFEFDRTTVLSAVLRCAVYPRADDPERAAKLQKMSANAYGLMHAGYRAAVSLAAVLAQVSAGKSAS